MKNRKCNLKKIFAVALLLCAATTMKAQIFIDDDDINSRSGVNSSDFNVMVGSLDYDGDQYIEYTPLGDGALLLAALGGAYLLNKRRKKAKQK